jgi:hypothetical protein
MFKRVSICAGTIIAICVFAAVAVAQDSGSELPKGWIVAAAPGIFDEPAKLQKVMKATDGLATPGREPADGWYAELGNMPTGAGWVSLGPGYRRHLLNGRAIAVVSASASWRLYGMFQGHVELPHLANDRVLIGVQARYQDLRQIRYFGVGNDSTLASGSAYRFKNWDFIGYGLLRANSWLSLAGRFGGIPQPDLLRAAGPRLSLPSTLTVFDETSAPGIASPPSFLHGDIALTADWTDHSGHPTRGGVYRVSAAGYADRDRGRNSFRRYEVEATQYVPLFTTKWIGAVRVWHVFSDTAPGQKVPFYLMPTVGGGNTLRGYTDFRFRDRHAQIVSVESRLALFTHVDLAAFADVGKVGARVHDLDLRHLKHSYGIGLRLHNASTTLARLDVGHSVEGWHVLFRMSEPLKRSAPASGRSAVVPFVQ